MKANTYRKTFDRLLMLYPASYRAEYGREIKRVQNELRRQYAREGNLRVFWLRLMADTAIHAASAHLARVREIMHMDTSVKVSTIGRGLVGFLRVPFVLFSLFLFVAPVITAIQVSREGYVGANYWFWQLSSLVGIAVFTIAWRATAQLHRLSFWKRASLACMLAYPALMLFMFVMQVQMHAANVLVRGYFETVGLVSVETQELFFEWSTVIAYLVMMNWALPLLAGYKLRLKIVKKRRPAVR